MVISLKTCSCQKHGCKMMVLYYVVVYYHNRHRLLERYSIHQTSLHSENWSFGSMMSVVFPAWLSYQNTLTYILSYPIGQTNGSCPSTTSFVFCFWRSLSSSFTWWSDLYQKWIAIDYSVGNAVQYEEENLWHRCWTGPELNRYFI